ncbi:post-transcriptional regulator [Paenibacillus terrigena]|uniref:post-transcriptional regulator n=1 Tax=Paenibacillus terrigena TaxID=369333 RepID=UPI0028D1A3D5|nr:post-transcriptional regulator [Paenibacillus terrigena]
MSNDWELDQNLDEVFAQLCQSKAEEFHLIGYEHVTAEEIWECVSNKYVKKGMPQLHQVVNDILSLKATSFMNYMTMAAFKGSPFG